MSNATQFPFAKDSWQNPRNARTLRALMALRNEEIGQRLTSLRHQKGNPPQEVVAAAVGVSYRSYQAWESGQTKPSWRSLTKVAAYYGVTPEWILVGEEEAVTKATPDLNAALGGQPEWAIRMEAKLDAVLDALTRAGLTEPTDPRVELERELEERVQEELQARQRADADAASQRDQGRRRKAR